MDKYTVSQARRLSNISITEMACSLGLSRSAYFNKEKGLSRFYYDEAMRLSSIVRIPADRILFPDFYKSEGLH